MSTFCVIGNSHISAFVLGWREMESEYPETSLEFFAAKGSSMRALGISGGSLVPQSAELREAMARTSQREEISGSYDAYLLCGLRLGILHLARMFKPYRVDRFTPDERAPLSEACFLEALRGCISATLAIETLRKLREITAAPVVVIAEPLPTRNYAKCDFLNSAEERREAGIVARLYETACASVCRELDALSYFQPAHTRDGVLRTHRKYSDGGMRLKEGFTIARKKPDSLATHMNGTFGALSLREIFGAIGAGLDTG